MFGNLVQIELIRLVKNKTLKVCAVVGLIILIFFLMIGEFLISLNALNFPELEGITSVEFLGIVIATSFAAVMQVVIPVTVVYTTCGYQKERLAVNIEGAVRSRLKLCMSEITGIALFTAIANLFLFPWLLVAFLVHPSDIVFLFSNSLEFLLIMYALGAGGSLYVSIVVYLVSKFTPKAPLALAISFLVSVFIGVMTVVMAMIVRVLPEGMMRSTDPVEIALYVLMAVPVVVLSSALALRYRKADRI